MLYRLGISVERRHHTVDVSCLVPNWKGARNVALNTKTTDSTIARLVRDCLLQKGRISLAVVSLIGLGLSQLALPWLVKMWVEGPLTNGDADIGGFVATASIIAVLIAVFLFSSRALLASVNQRFLEHLRSTTVAHVLSLEPKTVRRYQSGDLMSRVFQDAGLLSGFVQSLLKRVLGDGILALGALVMMAVIDVRLALAAVLLVPLLAVIFWAIGTVIRRLAAVAQRRMGELSSILQQQLQGFTTVKGFQTEEFEDRRFADTYGSYRREVILAEGWTAALMATVFLLATLAFVVAIWFGSREVANGAITAGSLLAFCLYAGQTIEPIRRLAETHGLLQRALAAGERLYQVLDLEPAALEPARVSRPAGGCSLQFDRTSFSYQPGCEVLHEFNVDIRVGEQVAIVAASGGGKSTIASLVLRFLDPVSGTIRLDGVDLKTYSLDDLRRLICVVEQRPFLLNAPLVDNIRYGSWDASTASIEEAVRLTGLDELQRLLPHGLDTLIDEAGRDLSGGQRQRIVLARAILRDPAVLVLDEATSALDSEAEGRILDDLDEWLSRRTVVLMAHRLSTISRSPLVIVLHDGEVAAQASPAELSAHNEVFRTLFADQLEATERRPGDRTSLPG